MIYLHKSEFWKLSFSKILQFVRTSIMKPRLFLTLAALTSPHRRPQPRRFFPPPAWTEGSFIKTLFLCPGC